MTLQEFVRSYRVDNPRRFRLGGVDPRDTGKIKSKQRARQYLERGVNLLAELQDRLYAQDRWSVLCVFQAMDAAGKDSTIKHVMSGVNPQGVQVVSFKQPSAEELDHDFLWRTNCRLPERGRIGIFNRSYYEEVLVARIHPEILAAQKLPPGLVGKKIWEERYEDINAYERYLARQGMLILKFFLHVSRQEQKDRFLERIETPAKNWKFSLADVHERQHWDRYMEAYEDAVRATSTPWARWHVVPADHKWFTRLVVAGTIVEGLERLDLKYPSVGPDKKKELAAAKKRLVSEA